MHQTLKPYDAHGVVFNSTSADATDAEGSCPFCNHSRRVFYVNLETGKHKCHHCKASGNVYTFLAAIHELHFAATNIDDWKELSRNRRGIPWTLLRDAGLASCGTPDHPRWLIPVRNPKNAIVNLRIYRPDKYVSATSGLPLQLYRLESLKGRHPIYLCEGEWDALALERLRRKTKKKGTVLAVPGAGIFKNEWKTLFHNRDVVICFDNDNAGADGAERVCEILQGHAHTLRILRWPSDAPDKWDIRDTIFHELDETRGNPTKVWSDLNRMFQVPIHLLSSESSGDKGKEEVLDLPRRTSFKTVVRDYKAHYHVDRNMVDGLAIIFATVLSIQLPGDPIWLFMVAPPGSGKTLLLSSLYLSPWVVFKSSLTPKSLISGFMTESGDPSLIPKLMGKVLVLKDYTEITSMGKETQEEIYGILRGAFDGHCEKTFGNGLTRSYPDCHFAMLAGVTDIIHGDDRASLGERFLKYQLVDSIDYDSTKHILAAVSGMATQVEAEKMIRRVAASFTNRDMESIKIPQPRPWLLDRIVAVSQVISHLRATVPHIGRDELAYRPSPEVGTRLAKQLVKLGQCLAVVYGKSEIDKDCWLILKRVALDTAKGWNLDVFLTLAESYPNPILRELVTQRSRMAETTCNRRLENMLHLSTVERVRLKQVGIGRPPYGWKLADEIAQLWKLADRP